MHDIKSIRDNPQAFDAGLKRRGLAPLSSSLLAIDEGRRAAITHLERALARRNEASKEIGEAKKKKDDARTEDLMVEVTQLKAAIAELEKTPRELEGRLNGLLAAIPNLPLLDVPDGADERANQQRHVFGEARSYGFAPKPHDDLGGALGFMDFEAAAKLSGARFVVLKKGLARLERAIGQFMLDLHTNEHGYTEINPPLLVRDSVMFGTGQLPKFEDDQFFAIPDLAIETEALLDNLKYAEEKGPQQYAADAVASIDMFLDALEHKRLGLIPTAEVPLTNLVRESILDEKE